MRLFRRKAHPRLEAAMAAHAGGDFVRARELAVEIVQTDRYREADALFARFDAIELPIWEDFDAMTMTFST